MDVVAPANRTVLETVIGGVQKLTVMALAGMLVVVMLLSTVHLGVLIGEQVWKPPRWLIPVQGLLEIFGYFLLVLIGVELLETAESLRAEGRDSCAGGAGSCAHRHGAEGHYRRTECRIEHDIAGDRGADSGASDCVPFRAAGKERTGTRVGAAAFLALFELAVTCDRHD